ncbi:hypothetical protein HAX54_027359, partial [Datura stramonium]|nr:hypothetical protein [Datura stramonium]
MPHLYDPKKQNKARRTSKKAGARVTRTRFSKAIRFRGVKVLIRGVKPRRVRNLLAREYSKNRRLFRIERESVKRWVGVRLLDVDKKANEVTFPSNEATKTKKIVDVLRLTEQSLAAISRPIADNWAERPANTNPLWRFSVPSFLSFIQSLASAIKSSVSEDTLYFGSPTGAALECAYLSLSLITFCKNIPSLLLNHGEPSNHVYKMPVPCSCFKANVMLLGQMTKIL